MLISADVGCVAEVANRLSSREEGRETGTRDEDEREAHACWDGGDAEEGPASKLDRTSKRIRAWPILL
jgi:hypothetical protein